VIELGRPSGSYLRRFLVGPRSADRVGPATAESVDESLTIVGI
jgi:hypothetical protein